MKKIEKCVDTLLVISNDKLLSSNEKIVTMSSAFTLADSVLKNTIDTITNIVFNCGTVNLDFNDLKTVLGDKGYGHLGIGYADENTSITDAVKQAVSSPLLNTNLSGAKYLMINSSGDINLIELNNAIRYIQEIVGTETKIMWGTVSSKEQLDDNKNSLITIIATGLNESTETNRNSIQNNIEKNSTNVVKTTHSINELLAKSENKSNELVIPTFLQSRMRK